MDKNQVKAKIKRKIRWYYFKLLQSPRHLLLYRSYRHYLLHRKKADIAVKKTDCYQGMYLTKEVHPTAGIGDQLGSWNSGLYYAKMFGITYAYSRFYPDRWEIFLGFGEQGVHADELVKHDHFRKVFLPMFDDSDEDSMDLIRRIMASYTGKKVIFLLELDQIYGDQYGVAEDLKFRFNHAVARKKDRLIYHEEETNIAIHIRRGDIMAGQEKGDPSLTFRFMANDYYVKALQMVLERLVGGKAYHIYVFSQGNATDFPELQQFDHLTFCVDMSATDSFLHMIRADILITSKSSFSYKPALISEGIKVCPKNFWHGYPADPSWILLDDEGNVVTNEKE